MMTTNMFKNKYLCCKTLCGLLLFFTSLASYAQTDINEELQRTEKLKLLHPDSAYYQLKNILQRASAEKQVLAEAEALQQLGYIFYHHGSYSQALNHYLQADKLYREADKKDLLAKNLNDIGTVYYGNRQGKMSLPYYNEALRIYQGIKDVSGMAGTYGMIGHIYEKTTKYDSAFYFQRLALQYYRQVNDNDGIADIYENLASIFEDKEVYDSSFIYYTKALQVYEQNRNIISQISLHNNLGDIYRKTGRYKQGLAQTQAALALALATNEAAQINSAYNDISKTYNLMGVNDSAYYYNALSRKKLLDIYTVENSKQLAFTQVLYDTERKNNEILKLENERQTNIIIIIATAIIIGLVLMLAVVTISRQRLKIKTQTQINEQEKQVFATRHSLMETDLHNKKLQEESLTKELELKSRELTSYTLHIIQKNELLENLKQRLEELLNDDKRDHKKQIKQILQQISQNFNNDKYWEELNSIFEYIHQSFFTNLQKHCHDLTSAELRLATLLKINLNSSDMAKLLGISLDSLRIARYRLRKKLQLDQGANLTAFIQSL